MSILDTTIVNVALDTLQSRAPRADRPDPVGRDRLPAVAGGGDPGHRLGGAALRRKRVYLVSLVLFTAGSALCGLATTTTELIVFRVLQGIGGG